MEEYMRYTRAQLQDIAKNYSKVREVQINKPRDEKASINSLMSSLVAKGLNYREDKLSFHSSGRSEHTYDASELMGYLGGYLAAVEDHNWCLKKAQVTAIFEHFKSLGYESSDPTLKKKSKIRRLREAIFSKEKSDQYYANL